MQTSTAKQRLVTVVLMGALTWFRPALHAEPSASSLPEQSLRVEAAETIPLPPGGQLKISAGAGRLFLVDARNHRVLAWDGSSMEIRGVIGNGPGEFFYPTDLAVEPDGDLWVLDGGNERIQHLDSSGDSLLEFPTATTAMGIASAREGTVVLGQPRSGSLLVARHASGETDEFGSLLQPEHSPLDEEREYDEAFHYAINRVQLTTDDGGRIWVSFIHQPLVRVYTPEGELLHEVDLSDLGFAERANKVWTVPGERWSGAALNVDGVQLPVLLWDVAYHPGIDRVLLLAADGRVIALNDRARPTTIFRLPSDHHPRTLGGWQGDTLFLSGSDGSELLRAQLTGVERIDSSKDS